MDEKKWLDEYSGQSVDELIELEAEYRIDSLVLVFEQAIDQKAARIGIENLTVEERVILAIEALEREVNNGGYDQFFTNSSKEFACVVLDSLNRIGCPKTASITKEAIAALGMPGPATVEGIDDVIYQDDEQREEQLSECDHQYFNSRENIEGRLFEFIKSNGDKITLDPVE